MEDFSEYEFSDDSHVSSYFHGEDNVIDLLESYTTNPHISKKEVVDVAVHAIQNLFQKLNELTLIENDKKHHNEYEFLFMRNKYLVEEIMDLKNQIRKDQNG